MTSLHYFVDSALRNCKHSLGLVIADVSKKGVITFFKNNESKKTT
jgi:hypothetical protein